VLLLFDAEKKAKESVGTPTNSIQIPEETDTAPPPLQIPPERRENPSRNPPSTASLSVPSFHDSDQEIDSLPNPAILRKVLEKEMATVDGELGRVQELATEARRIRDELENAKLAEKIRLAEIGETLAALKEGEESKIREIARLEEEKRVAVEEEERLRARWKVLQKEKDSKAAELEAARGVETAQREFEEAKARLRLQLEARRLVLEDMRRAVAAAWQKGGRLPQKRVRREAEEIERRERAKREERERAERAACEELCARKAAEEKSKREEAAEEERRQQKYADRDQAELLVDKLSKREKEIKRTRVRAEVRRLIMRVGSPEAKALASKGDLRRAFKLAAFASHSDKGNEGGDGLKEMTDCKSSLDRLRGW
jgi:DNA repair exonuclease SbcCD ATPase subunit